MNRALPAAISAFCTAALSPSSLAQCEPGWLPGTGSPGVSGYANALAAWDPDGRGAKGAQLVVGGAFGAAGQVPSPNVALWDGFDWHALGQGLPGEVTALCVHQGQLIVGGGNAGAPGRGAFRWSGVAWEPMGNLGQDVNVLRDLDGQLFAGTSAYFRQWNGADWSVIGYDLSGDIRALASWNHQLVAGGHLRLEPNPTHIDRAVVFDGVRWTQLGTAFNDDVLVLAEFEGELIVGGAFDDQAAGIQHIARWGGAEWLPMGDGFDRS